MRAPRRPCGLFCSAALVAAALAPPATAAESVSAAAIVRDLRSGRPVVLNGATVKGPLLLDHADAVHSVFKCRECTFQGSVSVADVTFDRTIDLSGSTFRRSVDFRGATFRAPALFRAALSDKPGDTDPTPATFERRADFSLAVFDDLASFAGSEFLAESVFRDTRFADSTFATAVFSGTTAFERASFRGPTTFNAVDFEATAVFEEADFQHRADFSLARFEQGGIFTAAQFGSGVSFLAAEFVSTSTTSEAAAFDSAASAKNMDFTFTVFESQSRRPQVIAIFDDVVIAGSLVLRDPQVPKNDRLHMKRVQVTNLVMDVDLAKQIENEKDRRNALELIEESAKTRSELGVANDAHYELRVLQSQDFRGVKRVLDHRLYRDVGGYLVRPARPLLILLAVVLFATAVRLVARRGIMPVAAGKFWRRAPGWTWAQSGNALTCLLDTFARVSPRWSSDSSTLALAERLELIAYRVLLIAALVALANSNPTLREMVDALV